MIIKSDRNNVWRKLKRPIKVLSPMAGYTDSAFRTLARELGADLVMTELISADAVAYATELRIKNYELGVGKKNAILHAVTSKKNQPTANLLSFSDSERPIIVQLFGKNPENFAKAAKWISEELKPDGIDINMGCPARKVVGSDHGAALLKNPELACEIVGAVKKNTDLPVSVKTRLGWDNDDQILEFAPKLVEAGVDAIIIHGRTYKDGFKGKARWENIFKVKELLGDKVVVIGNGDLQEIPNDKYQMTNSVLDGVAIGRAAIGKPWIFSKDEVNPDELKKIALRHAKLAFERKGEHGIIEFRKHLLFYLKGFPGAKELRKQAVAVQSYQDVEKIISTFQVVTLDHLEGGRHR